MKSSLPVRSVGLGLRRSFLAEIAVAPPAHIDFYEIAPENWMKIGGQLGRQLRSLTERCSFICHGLSLSLGGPAPLDESFLLDLRRFLNRHQIACYSEHLSYCGDEGHLYDLMPIPFTPEAARHTAARIRRTQDILERRIAVENVSYYAAPGQEMTELDFLLSVLSEADCDLLLDVNNIYVNSINHGYSAVDFLERVPVERVVYLHVAGHYLEADDFLVDTHGAAVIDPVWRLLERAYARFGVLPTVLERDFNIPPLPVLYEELNQIRLMQNHPLESQS
ncbi:MAG: HvfB family MNIO-type RiPP peptide maturase [Methylococcaceae bacterium]